MDAISTLPTARGGEGVRTAEDFRAMVAPHWSDLVRFARRAAPSGQGDDVLQDAMTNAWRKRAQFDPARGTARNWLLAIVADQARKGHRRQRPHFELVDDGYRNESEYDVDLHRALDTLTVRQRTVVALHYYLGLRTAEVAEVLGCSTGTVKSTLSDARARLRERLGEDYRDD